MRPVRKEGSISSEVQAYLLANPSSKGRDVAVKFGCNPALVSIIRSECGLGGCSQSRFNVKLSRENALFLNMQSRGSNVTREQMIDALITDARIEAEDAMPFRNTQETTQ